MEQTYSQSLREIVAFAIDGGGSPSRKMFLLERFARTAIPVWEKFVGKLMRDFALDKDHIRGEYMPSALEIIGSFWIKFQEKIIDDPRDALVQSHECGAEPQYIFAMLKNHLKDELARMNIAVKHTGGADFDKIAAVVHDTRPGPEAEAIARLEARELAASLAKFKETNPENWLILTMVHIKNMKPGDLTKLFEGNIYYRIKKAEQDFGRFLGVTPTGQEGGNDAAL